MSIDENLTNDMKSAMKSKDSVKLSTIRALKSAMKNVSIENGTINTPLDDSEILGIIRKQVKQRNDSIAQFNKAKRLDLVAIEKKELEVLQQYLPPSMTQQEIETAVALAITEVSASKRGDMGKVMAILQKRTEGRAEGAELSQAVMKQLS